MAHWYTETYNDEVRLGFKVERTLHSSKSKFQTIEVFETTAMGTTLALDGLYQTSVGDEFYYHEMITHPALCTAGKLANVLVIGGGDGGTAREVLRHEDVAKCTMVEIDGEVVDACKKHLPTLGAWEDPRLELLIEDGIDYVRRAPESSFDVVILDNSDPVGPSEGLFGAAFYQGVRRILAPEGLFVLQSESPFLMPLLFESIQFELRKWFKSVTPLFAPVPIYGGSQWSWTIAGVAFDPQAPAEDRIAKISKGTRYYNRSIHGSAFSQSNDIVRRLAAPRP